MFCVTKMNTGNKSESKKDEQVVTKGVILKPKEISNVEDMFSDNPNVVYTSYYNWIIIFEKLTDTKTNEGRAFIFDALTALYRADKLKVIDIINKFEDNVSVDEIINDKQKDVILYKKGEIVYAHTYDSNVDVRIGPGLYYYKSILPAYYLDLTLIEEGEWCCWNLDGHISKKCYYKDGKLDGNYIEWSYDNILLKECFYRNGMLDGYYIQWYNKNKLRVKCFYKKGMKDGKYMKWHPNNNVDVECTYINDLLDGEYNKFTIDGKKLIKCDYKNGVKNGEYKKWTKDEKICIITNYKNDELDGTYLEYDEHGKMIEESMYENGKLNGLCKKYRNNRVIHEITYDKGKAL